MTDYKQLNALALAYVGDAIYETYVRDYLVREGQTRPNKLHHMATHFVSAKAQAMLIQKMLDDGMLTEEEQGIYRRGRTAKRYTTANNTNIMTYRMSTVCEAFMGYLHLLERKERLEELIAWCLEKAGETNEG